MASNLESSLAAKGSDTLWDFSCDACNKNEAQFYCEGCSKCYCGNCVKLHNQLFNSH
ncbi:hypothetical protein DPMN_184360 [Dreissena polymorpha]|uniref:B box-type domain-containing protein n=1 Tax=Dreissena polymorpha TaxID=45954 RepID=A0A9D4I6B2_DREPO|nr:hypothetical protein DPMN_184360 [Dreissena polymorpha]